MADAAAKRSIVRWLRHLKSSISISDNRIPKYTHPLHGNTIPHFNPFDGIDKTKMNLPNFAHDVGAGRKDVDSNAFQREGF